ncbi:MAG: ribonuclease III [Turicibacter sp.]|nr:ribonuclease III [Turicibacter sp.]
MLKLDYTFKNPNLLKQALTHSSLVNEQNLSHTASNERLEFLGDAVLELLISDILYRENPNLKEGELTRMRASLVCTESLANRAKRLGIGGHIRMSRGEMLTGGEKKDSILADVLEAIIGAIFLDGGLVGAQNFINAIFSKKDRTLASTLDAKTMLQEKIQKKSRTPLEYILVNQEGPDHEKLFMVTVSHEGRILGNGNGRTKKEAEQKAAKKALQQI